jgi:hypothetical protein
MKNIIILEVSQILYLFSTNGDNVLQSLNLLLNIGFYFSFYCESIIIAMLSRDNGSKSKLRFLGDIFDI